ncbi:MAG TPA: glucoamylase family protein [Bryobacteraceae bacterium]|nr:glucoamylase family protein [Bryobacteraceae bacterium]
MISRRGFVQSGIAAASSSFLIKSARASTNRERLLDDVQRRAVRYFYYEADPYTGLVKDRARNSYEEDRRIVASIAATGFGLSALATGDRRGYIPRSVALERVERTLEHLARMETQQGFYYHFIDMRTGDRAWNCEISSVDTSWLLCGLIHARAHFDTSKIDRLANEILDRVNWKWMLNESDTLSHGWTPESGFLPYRWDSYSELMAMYLLALGSKTNPIPARSWDAWRRPTRTYAGLKWIDSDTPLFTHQYSHAFFDFRQRRDKYANYFQNSRLATEAHRIHCVSLAKQFPWYSNSLWGVTASDSRIGYSPWGGFDSRPAYDGTVVPCAAAGSLPFLPEPCMTVLETTFDKFGSRVWGRYGFSDAFHPHANWTSPDVIGIDLGISLLMAENYRTGSVWDAMMSTDEAKRGMQAASLA